MDDRYGLGMTRREAQKALKEDAGLELLQKAKELRVIANQWQSALELYAFFGLQEYLKPNSYSYEEDRKSVEALLNAIDDYPDIVTIDLFCRMLGGIGDGTARKLLRGNHVEHFYIRNTYFIPKVSIIDYLLSSDYETYKTKLKLKADT